jgi:hypothetical protein
LKSHICLTKALKFVQDPAAKVLIVRRSYPQLKISGGMVDTAKEIYPYFKAEWGAQALRWKFPNGATITFGAIPDDLKKWQG